MKSYRELDIYTESKRLAIEIHKESLTFQKFELYGEGSQIRRLSKAVTSAIVEGYGRKKYKNDFIKFLTYAQSECDETIVHIDFVFQTGSMINKERFDYFIVEYTALSKKINKFNRYVEESWNDFPQPGNV